jgi:3-oxoacyl-(acyl-carrier-protein) synthase
MGESARDRIRVVVTGIGVLSGFGTGRDVFADGVFSGNSAIRRIERFDTAALNCHFGAELAHFDGQDLIPKSERPLYDRVSLMAMAAADEALEQAGLVAADIGPVSGVMMGSAFGPGGAIQESVLRIAQSQRIRPTSIIRMMLHSPTAALCARYRLQRDSQAHATACAASAHAIAQAVQAVRRGEMEICLAGGAEAFPTSALFAAWDALSIMSPETDPAIGIMRPFSKDRKGFVIGEAAAVLVLEREDRARARGAEIMAEICGVGAVSDTPTLTKPTLAGMIRAMQGAMADAGLVRDDVGHINAHGTATELNDALESEAINELFGPHAGNIKVSACKSATGHCMGAASAIEAAATVLALQRQRAPCAVDLIGRGTNPGRHGGSPDGTSPMRADVALSNSFAFGGHYVTLAFRRIVDTGRSP